MSLCVKGKNIKNCGHLQLNEIVNNMKNVAEGINTTQAALVLANQHNLNLPLIEGTGSILFNNSNPHEIINMLLSKFAE